MARTGRSGTDSGTVFTQPGQPCHHVNRKRSAAQHTRRSISLAFQFRAFPFLSNSQRQQPAAREGITIAREISAVFPHACTRARVSARRADPIALRLLRPGLLSCLRDGETSLCRLDAVVRYCILGTSSLSAQYLPQIRRTASPFRTGRLLTASLPVAPHCLSDADPRFICFAHYH
jgi:hypothetical protein